MTSKRAVFLDRDGVINAYAYNPEFGTVDSPANPAEFTLLPGVEEAIATLNQLGLLVIIASNQPGIAKGKFTTTLLDAITHRMTSSVQKNGGKIDAVYYCLHHPEGTVAEYRAACDCRKPKPGLLLKAAQEWGIDLKKSYMVGDGITDVLAGHAAGAKTVFVGSRKSYICEELSRQGAEPDFIVSGLPEAAQVIRNLETDSQRDASRNPDYTAQYIREAAEVLRKLDHRAIERTVDFLAQLRERGGRLFFLGVGGGAGHASHAVCDFRKIAGIEAYTPSDNVSELTARINDDGWDTAYVNWLRGSRLKAHDMVFVFSVGGGDEKRNISTNLVRALQCAREVGATICGVVGRDGGFTAKVADACILVPVINPETVTPHTESFQALVWHLLISHPKLRAAEMKWESVK